MTSAPRLRRRPAGRLGPAQAILRLSGPQLLVGSFAGLIVLGTCALRLLPGLYVGPGLGWLDSLFTATSAVCVTGLIVVDTATYFTPAGQLLLLLLIQLGGLGMITLSTAIILALGGRLTLGQEEVSAPGVHLLPGGDLRRLTGHVVLFTVVFELAGAAVLTALWTPRFGLARAAWHALFQSVSAFCNAGFSTFSDSLTSFAEGLPTILVMAALIVAGGLGFLTIEELLARRRRRTHRSRLTLHTRLVLVTTAVLLLVGWALYGALEWHGALAGLGPTDRVANALFMSVTARTAGFNTVDYASVSAGGGFLTVLLMTVGGSPGSTAGGLKTTTLAVVVLLAWSRVRGRRATHAGDRSIPDETVQRAVGLVVFAGFVVVGAIFLVAAREMDGGEAGANLGFLRYAFETVSAFNTVGLSMGVTGDLDRTGRLVAIVLMFLGRVGPLTFTAAVARRARRPAAGFRYAHEDVVVG